MKKDKVEDISNRLSPDRETYFYSNSFDFLRTPMYRHWMQ